MKDVMFIIFDDTVEGDLHGVEGVDTYGRTVKLFLDQVSLFRDYRYVLSGTDVMGHI